MTTILVDIPEATLAAVLEDAEAVDDAAALEAGETATDAVVADALRLWATLENPREVLQGRDDVICRSDPEGLDAAEVVRDA